MLICRPLIGWEGMLSGKQLCICRNNNDAMSCKIRSKVPVKHEYRSYLWEMGRCLPVFSLAVRAIWWKRSISFEMSVHILLKFWFRIMYLQINSRLGHALLYHSWWNLFLISYGKNYTIENILENLSSLSVIGNYYLNGGRIVLSLFKQLFKYIPCYFVPI